MTFKNKKAALVGIAAGRAGNLRGLDHLADILNHVGAITFPSKLPISSIGEVLDNSGTIKEETVQAMTDHAKAFLAF